MNITNSPVTRPERLVFAPTVLFTAEREKEPVIG